MLRAMKLRKFTVPQLNGEEMADIVAYLRSFQYFGEPGIPILGASCCGKSNASTAIRWMAEAARGRRT